MTFIAKYPGECVTCGEDIQGELAKYIGSDIAHETCPGSELDRDTTRPVCESCWLLMPCDWGD